MRSTGACSALTRPRRAGCAGIGSTASTRRTRGTGPLIWIAREGPSIIGQYATMPVALSVKGQDVVGSWGMDVMVAPERQRQGLGELLFSTWDRHVGASLGLGLSPSSHRLFQKLRWPEVGPVPYLVKPLTRRAFRRAEWPMVLNRLVSAVTLPYVKFVARQKPLSGEVRLIRRFDASFDKLWARLAPRFDLAVRRDAAYLQWKFVSPPHVRYAIAALYRDGEAQGYVVYRHAREPRGKVTLLVDFLVDPDEPDGARHAAPLGRSRGAGRGLGQDPRLLPARRLPQDPQVRGLRAGGVLAAVRDQAERPDAAAGLLHEDRPVARHAGRFGPGSMTACTASSAQPKAKAGSACSSASTPRATTSGTLAARERPTFENLYALPALHERFRRHGVRPTYVVTWPVAQGSAIGRRAARAARVAHLPRLARTITRGRRRRRRRRI